MSKVGKNIKKIRNVKALSQQAFADLFQLTRGNISSYEEFRAEPKIETIVNIAKYFGIPLNDFILKELSVNELLHYNTELVLETEKLKKTHNFIEIPYVSSLDIADYETHYNDKNFIRNLPHINIPINTKSKLIAIEVQDSSSLPLGFNFKNGDILLYEQVVKENIHRIENKLGLMVDEDGLKYGVYKEYEGKKILSLNEWVKYPFNIESYAHYWILRALFTQATE